MFFPRRPGSPGLPRHAAPSSPIGGQSERIASRSLITIKPRMKILIPTGPIRVRALGKSAWIEITEATLIDDDGSVVRLLRQSRLPGVQIALYAISSERNITTTAECVETKEQCENCSGSAAPRCRVSCSVAPNMPPMSGNQWMNTLHRRRPWQPHLGRALR